MTGRLRTQVNAAGTRTCRGSEDAELRPACAASCRDACRDGLAVYTAESSALSGFKVQPVCTCRPASPMLNMAAVATQTAASLRPLLGRLPSVGTLRAN